MSIMFSSLIFSDCKKDPGCSCIFTMDLLLLLYKFTVGILFKLSSLYFLKLSPFYLFSVIAYDSNCYVSVLVFSYFSLILSFWENAKHNSKSVSHQIRSQDDKLYCVCEDSCSRLCISAKKHNHFHFENLLYTSSYFKTNRHIVLTVIKVL